MCLSLPSSSVLEAMSFLRKLLDFPLFKGCDKSCRGSKSIELF